MKVVVLVFARHREAAVLNLIPILAPEPSYIWASVWISGPGALQLQDNRLDHLNPLGVDSTCAWQRLGLVRQVAALTIIIVHNH